MGSSSRSRSRSEESGQQRPKEDVPNRLTAKRLRREQAKKDASEWAVNATAESTSVLGRWRSPSPVQRDSPVYALDEEVGTALPAPWMTWTSPQHRKYSALPAIPLKLQYFLA